jgi:hypothetical protein
MAKQRVVNTRFWDDDYVTELDPFEKLLFLYFLTNPLTDLCGAYEVSLKRIAFDTGLKPSKITEILESFEAGGKILYRKGWVFIRNFGKHQQGNSPNVKKGAERSLNACPDWVKQTLSKGWVSIGIENALLPEPIPVGQLEPELEPTDMSAVADGVAVDPVEVVFTYWQENTANQRSSLTALRRSKIKARLQRYTVPQILSAIDGCNRSPHHQGHNDSGTIYNDIELICRDDTKLEKFISYNDRTQTNGKPKSEREKSAERTSNAVTAIDELRRLGAEQRLGLPSGVNGVGSTDIITIESAESH